MAGRKKNMNLVSLDSATCQPYPFPLCRVTINMSPNQNNNLRSNVPYFEAHLSKSIPKILSFLISSSMNTFSLFPKFGE